MARDILQLLIALAGIAALIGAAVTGDLRLLGGALVHAAAALALEWTRR